MFAEKFFKNFPIKILEKPNIQKWKIKKRINSESQKN